MLTSRAHALRSGTEVRLAVAPRDPRSLMRGDYRELNYTIAHFANAKLPTEPSQCNGKPVCSVLSLAAYVTLAPNADGVAEVRGIDTVPPPAGTLFIKGKFRGWPLRSEPVPTARWRLLHRHRRLRHRAMVRSAGRAGPGRPGAGGVADRRSARIASDGTAVLASLLIDGKPVAGEKD